MQLDVQWIVGFVDGEGCFHVGLNPNNEMRAGYQVLPEFTVVQHRRDVQVLQALKAHFGCGVVRVNHGDRFAYRVRGLKHLLERIIPFFVKHPLKTQKNVDFIKFRRILLLMENGAHLRDDGVEEIRTIAKQMNRGAFKIKSDSLGNTGEKSSEIPCRVSNIARGGGDTVHQPAQIGEALHDAHEHCVAGNTEGKIRAIESP